MGAVSSMSGDAPSTVDGLPDVDDAVRAAALARHHHDAPDLAALELDPAELESEELGTDAIDAVTTRGLALVDDVVDDDDLPEDAGDELDDEVDPPDDDPDDGGGPA
jgi:hypothetical protein